jgi:hypothetical protein
MPRHVVLLGDSIFDNASYTRGEPDVVTHLRDLLPAPWKATLSAVDGATTTGLGRQIARIPADVSHLVVSVGGNDALGNSDLLRTRVSSTTEALRLFDARVSAFEADYRRALAPVLALGRDTTLCTVYNGDLDAQEASIARVALGMFNDAIVRIAVEHRLKLIELRQVCTERADYANPIEPSGRGGRKIAEAIARAIGASGGSHGAVVFGG